MKNLNLVIKNKETNAIKTIHLGDRPVVIGRSSECDLQLPHNSISRKHARIEKISSGIIITDIGSTNGTFLNGKKIEKTEILKETDTINIGVYELKLSLPNSLDEEPGSTEMIMVAKSLEDSKEIKIRTLPFFLGVGNKKNELQGTTDPYTEYRKIKIDLEPDGFYAFNLFDDKNVMINGKPFRKEKIQPGTQITINNKTISFHMDIAGKSLYESMYSATSYKPVFWNKKRKIIASAATLSISLVIVLIYLLFIKQPTDWDQVNKDVATYCNNSLPLSEFLELNTLAEELIGKKINPLNAYSNEINNIRIKMEALENNKAMQASIALLVPRHKSNISVLFEAINNILITQELYQRFKLNHGEFQRSYQKFKKNNGKEYLLTLKSTSKEALESYFDLRNHLSKLLNYQNQIQDISAKYLSVAEKFSKIYGSNEFTNFLSEYNNKFKEDNETFKQLYSKLSVMIKKTEQLNELIPNK